MPIETDWTIAVTEVPQNGVSFTRTATASERAAVAKALDLLDCTDLGCKLRVKPLRQGRYQVKGQLTAAVVQACVVSLEPVENQIAEAIDVEFRPKDEIGAAPAKDDDAWLDPEAPDGAEAIEQGHIGIGRLVYECLASGLDPYPRKVGATLGWTEPEAARAAVHPFAPLAKLKKKE